MHPRTNVVDIFSAFIQFSEGTFNRWTSQPRLVKSMDRQLSQFADEASPATKKEAFWALYWYRQWQTQAVADPNDLSQLAYLHLCAYLQETGYWAADKITRPAKAPQYTLADGFQVAIAKVGHVLQRYQPSRGTSLKAYARTAFENEIRDWLRQQKAFHGSSPWGVLRSLGRKQLAKALKAYGYRQIEMHELAWDCFKAVYAPNPNFSTRKLERPSPEQFAQMVNRYNRLRFQWFKSRPLPPSIDDKALAHLLQQIVESVAYDRQLKRPEDIEYVEPVAIEAEEQQSWAQQLVQVLVAKMQELDSASQKLLDLRYTQKWCQNDIAKELDISQSQVMRRLRRIEMKLAHSAIAWTKENLHNSVDSDVILVADVVKEWLRHHFSPEDVE